MSQFSSTTHPHPSRNKKGLAIFLHIADSTRDKFVCEILPVDTTKPIPTYHKHSLKMWYIAAHKTQHMHAVVLNSQAGLYNRSSDELFGTEETTYPYSLKPTLPSSKYELRPTPAIN